ncbi:hypothetical protein IQ13_1567 [Lacibacter cauensis]|uniref:Uncharacterized protein n=2 Tax=Lacibacter cauensis TaxID=510947 RepID=A0A562SQD0_9BACT|nr:hypothetical protein IQ13_1567 [Lacibacter cauensis]
MTQKFTPEDLLQYLYKETTPAETEAIEKALAEDWTLREKFEVVKRAAKQLSQLNISPRTEAVLSVLKYANKTLATTDISTN